MGFIEASNLAPFTTTVSQKNIRTPDSEYATEITQRTAETIEIAHIKNN